MEELQEYTVEKMDFEVVKQKIIKANEILHLYQEKTEKLNKAAQAFKSLKANYEKATQQVNTFKLSNDHLTETLGKIKAAKEQAETELNIIKADYASLEGKYQEHLIESQLHYTDLEAKISQCTCNKNDNIVKSLKVKVKELKDSVAEMKSKEHELTIQMNKLKRRNSLLEGRCESKKAEVDEELQFTKEKLAATELSLKEQTNLYTNAVNSNKNEVNSLRKQIAQLLMGQQKLKTLEQECHILKEEKRTKEVKSCLTQTDEVKLVKHVAKRNIATQTSLEYLTSLIESSKSNKSDKASTVLEGTKVTLYDQEEELECSLSGIFREMILPMSMLSPIRLSKLTDSPLSFSGHLLDPMETKIKNNEESSKPEQKLPNIVVTPPTPNVDVTTIQYPLLSDKHESSVINQKPLESLTEKSSQNVEIINPPVEINETVTVHSENGYESECLLVKGQQGVLDCDSVINETKPVSTLAINKPQPEKPLPVKSRPKNVWYPYPYFVKSKSKRIYKQQNPANDKDTILKALQTLKRNNINFTITNEPDSQPQLVVQKLLKEIKDQTKSQSIFKKPHLLRHRRHRKRGKISSEFLSETESELEKLFEPPENVLERNKRLLQAAKQQTAGSDSEIMGDSGLVTASSKLDSTSSICSDAEVTFKAPQQKIDSYKVCPTLISPMTPSVKGSPFEKLKINSALCQQISFDGLTEGGMFTVISYKKKFAQLNEGSKKKPVYSDEPESKSDVSLTSAEKCNSTKGNGSLRKGRGRKSAPVLDETCQDIQVSTVEGTNNLESHDKAPQDSESDMDVVKRGERSVNSVSADIKSIISDTQFKQIHISSDKIEEIKTNEGKSVHLCLEGTPRKTVDSSPEMLIERPKTRSSLTSDARRSLSPTGKRSQTRKTSSILSSELDSSIEDKKEVVKVPVAPKSEDETSVVSAINKNVSDRSQSRNNVEAKSAKRAPRRRTKSAPLLPPMCKNVDNLSPVSKNFRTNAIESIGTLVANEETKLSLNVHNSEPAIILDKSQNVEADKPNLEEESRKSVNNQKQTFTSNTKIIEDILDSCAEVSVERPRTRSSCSVPSDIRGLSSPKRRRSRKSLSLTSPEITTKLDTPDTVKQLALEEISVAENLEEIISDESTNFEEVANEGAENSNIKRQNRKCDSKEPYFNAISPNIKQLDSADKSNDDADDCFSTKSVKRRKTTSISDKSDLLSPVRRRNTRSSLQSPETTNQTDEPMCLRFQDQKHQDTKTPESGARGRSKITTPLPSEPTDTDMLSPVKKKFKKNGIEITPIEESEEVDLVERRRTRSTGTPDECCFISPTRQRRKRTKKIDEVAPMLTNEAEDDKDVKGTLFLVAEEQETLNVCADNKNSPAKSLRFEKKLNPVIKRGSNNCFFESEPSLIEEKFEVIPSNLKSEKVSEEPNVFEDAEMSIIEGKCEVSSNPESEERIEEPNSSPLQLFEDVPKLIPNEDKEFKSLKLSPSLESDIIGAPQGSTSTRPFLQPFSDFLLASSPLNSQHSITKKASQVEFEHFKKLHKARTVRRQYKSKQPNLLKICSKEFISDSETEASALEVEHVNRKAKDIISFDDAETKLIEDKFEVVSSNPRSEERIGEPNSFTLQLSEDVLKLIPNEDKEAKSIKLSPSFESDIISASQPFSDPPLDSQPLITKKASQVEFKHFKKLRKVRRQYKSKQPSCSQKICSKEFISDSETEAPALEVADVGRKAKDIKAQCRDLFGDSDSDMDVAASPKKEIKILQDILISRGTVTNMEIEQEVKQRRKPKQNPVCMARYQTRSKDKSKDSPAKLEVVVKPVRPRKTRKALSKMHSIDAPAAPVDIVSDVIKDMLKTGPKMQLKRVVPPKVPPKVDICEKKVYRPETLVEDLYKDCPKSPEPSDVEEEVEVRPPRLIPLDKPKQFPPSKVISLMQKLIVYSSEEEMLDEVVMAFAFQDMDHMIRVIMNRLSLDVSDKANMCFAGPPMTTIQRILLGFLLKLDKITHPGILQKFLKAVEIRLFDRTKFELAVISPFTRVYTAICKMNWNLSRIRRFLTDAFYFCDNYALPILFIVITMWPDVLPMNDELPKYPLAKVIIQLTYTKTNVEPGFNLIPLRDLFVRYYHYPVEKREPEDFFRDILVDYVQNPSRITEYALILFLRHQPLNYLHKKLIGNFIPLYEAVPESNANLKATLVMTICNVCRRLFRHYLDDMRTILEVRDWADSQIHLNTHPVLRAAFAYLLQKLPRRPRAKRQLLDDKKLINNVSPKNCNLQSNESQNSEQTLEQNSLENDDETVDLASDLKLSSDSDTDDV